ncbi:MAG TPA: YkgJ family cysteine cluster protein [Candidatus Methanoperedens sp.]
MQTVIQNEARRHDLRSEIVEGLLYAHTRINANTTKTLETSSFLYALIELLSEKGLLTIEELDERKKQVADRLVKKFVESGMGLMYQDPEEDKYTFGEEAFVDCAGRHHVCRAICCKLPFALSRQDVKEGIVHWEFARPYLIAHGEDGYCVHLDRDTCHCTVREHRPLPCRGFSCQDNERWHVWADYEKMVLDQGFVERIKHAGKVYEGLERK